MAYPPTDPTIRFWRRVRKSDACWLWTSGFDKDGYGKFSDGDGRSVRAHRYAWTMANGPIPKGLCVCHRCDVPACVRPDHLWLGTNTDNASDMSRKGRSAKGDRNPSRLYPERLRRGDRHPTRLNPSLVRHERNGRAKLTWAQVDDIRTRFAAGDMTKAALGREYGVSEVAIGFIIRGTHWAGERVYGA